MPLHKMVDFSRHGGEEFMTFQSEGDQKETQLDNEEINMDAYEVIKGTEPNQNHREHIGIVHLVHGWIMRGQVKNACILHLYARHATLILDVQGLYISSDIPTSSSSLAATGSYYFLTQSVARALDAMFLAVFPEKHAQYKEAFEAGVWFQHDPGPFLGRAVIYKLQGRLHKDCHDLGPSASFGVGQYTGGEMLIPQFPSKFSYDPGHVCIFFSSTLYHKVAHFSPTLQTVEHKKSNLTPGRIGSVFFFPQESYQILNGKPANWGLETSFGRMENIFREGGARYREDEDEEEIEYESEEST